MKKIDREPHLNALSQIQPLQNDFFCFLNFLRVIRFLKIFDALKNPIFLYQKIN